MNYIKEKEKQQLIDCLLTEKYSCVIRNGNDIRVFRERGVKDLYCLLNEDTEFLEGAFVADKVVGKAAAALMILGGVKQVYAGVISQPAYQLFQLSNVTVEFTSIVPYIINRTKTGWCPLENLCKNCITAQECFPLIKQFIETLKR